MLPTLLTAIAVATAPPPGFAGTAVPTNGTTAGDFADAAKAAGFAVDLGSVGRNHALPGTRTPSQNFWDGCDGLARAANSRIETDAETGRVKFITGSVPAGRISAHGAFRVAARTITAKTDLATGGTAYDLELDLMWEPKIAVFRASAEPFLARATDDRGTVLTANPAAVKAGVSGFRHTAGVRIKGLTREATSIRTLTGEFTVTASPAWLPFEFTAPNTATGSGVGVSLVSFARVEDRWEATLDLDYPAGGPVFESFEADIWLSANKLSLALGGKEYAPANYELTERGRGTRAVYRFKGLPAAVSGYKLSYRTPAPPVEFAVPFTLSDLPLP